VIIQPEHGKTGPPNIRAERGKISTRIWKCVNGISGRRTGVEKTEGNIDIGNPTSGITAPRLSRHDRAEQRYGLGVAKSITDDFGS